MPKGDRQNGGALVPRNLSKGSACEVASWQDVAELGLVDAGGPAVVAVAAVAAAAVVAAAAAAVDDVAVPVERLELALVVVVAAAAAAAAAAVAVGGVAVVYELAAEPAVEPAVEPVVEPAAVLQRPLASRRLLVSETEVLSEPEQLAVLDLYPLGWPAVASPTVEPWHYAGLAVVGAELVAAVVHAVGPLVADAAAALVAVVFDVVEPFALGPPVADDAPNEGVERSCVALH